MELSTSRRNLFLAPPVALAIIITGLTGGTESTSFADHGTRDYPANYQRCVSASVEPAKAVVRAVIRVQEASGVPLVLNQTTANTSAGQFLREGGCGYAIDGTFVRIGGVSCKAASVTPTPTETYTFECVGNVVASEPEIVPCDNNPTIDANSAFCNATRPYTI